MAHTEQWTADQLAALPLDGFEMYNVHANLFLKLGLAADLMFRVERGEEGLPHPDLLILPLVTEDPRYVDTWGTVLARGKRAATTMGTDCHRNSLPQLTADGERIDSYRRMMIAFSNHLLVRPRPDGRWDDAELKEALRAGRLYGAFEYLGYPVGFDFVALEGGAVREMGESVSLSAGARLAVKAAKVRDLAPDAESPQIRVRLLHAREGGWNEVAASDGDLSFEPTAPGAYRAEVRITPAHLKGHIGRRFDWIREEKPWIYSNPIYVVP